jgi:hypothetical protein
MRCFWKKLLFRQKDKPKLGMTPHATFFIGQPGATVFQ